MLIITDTRARVMCTKFAEPKIAVHKPTPLGVINLLRDAPWYHYALRHQ